MPALNFRSQFPRLIEAGSKVFTLRARRKDGRDPKEGDALYLFTGMRTKACRRFGEKPCRFASWVRVTRHWVSIQDGPNVSSQPELDRFAVMDGFADWKEFREFHLPYPGPAEKSLRMVAWVELEEIKRRLFT